jgi:hypothetical protein
MAVGRYQTDVSVEGARHPTVFRWKGDHLMAIRRYQTARSVNQKCIHFMHFMRFMDFTRRGCGERHEMKTRPGMPGCCSRGAISIKST